MFDVFEFCYLLEKNVLYSIGLAIATTTIATTTAAAAATTVTTTAITIITVATLLYTK